MEPDVEPGSAVAVCGGLELFVRLLNISLVPFSGFESKSTFICAPLPALRGLSNACRAPCTVPRATVKHRRWAHAIYQVGQAETAVEEQLSGRASRIPETHRCVPAGAEEELHREHHPHHHLPEDRAGEEQGPGPAGAHELPQGKVPVLLWVSHPAHGSGSGAAGAAGG